ncbi:peptidylprolyl isomerase [Silvibacterium dinghuense]|uniref:Periplasmic chaperone PpiD n=1 Tax=Silvibacterium dinghuense TaxID=1560006 RepID=A0A4Q1SGG2_9BACT|nr:peptidylprolyl isomerase [Silvibacterium dinghuense]RXS96594.1 peptidylprolyl isomerase [Silvibacterium dinghuense]GGG92093.1 peptidylprolyl isomerase [Silvibacterium dinghuense]
MIRFLQKDSRFIKGVFIAIISVACITMVITLVPGIFQDQGSSSDTYATIGHGGFLGRFLPAEEQVSTTEVQQLAGRILQRQGLPAFALPFMMGQAGQMLIQQQILLNEAHRLGLTVTDEDVRRFLHTGMWGEVLFPGGKYIGDAQYANFVSEQFGLSRDKFEDQLKKEILTNRLQALITGSVTVSDAEVRTTYIQQGTKIKFDYAVLSSDDLRKTINPTDTELQAFFKQNAARYATAVPEARKIQYFAFTDTNLPQGAPQVSDAEIQQYYTAHQKDYQIEDQVKVRHILIKVDGSDPKADAAAKAKAQGILDQLHHGGDFAALAKANSDDPGSKVQGGELGWIKHGTTVPEFDKAAFSLAPGQTSGLVRTQFGYHIIQTEEKQTAHTRPLDEVKPEIQAMLIRQKEGQQELAFAAQLSSEAQKSGMAATASAHHLQLVTTDDVNQSSNLTGVTDSSKLLAAAFTAKKNAAPQTASTGDGYAVFQVIDIQAAHAPTFDAWKDHITDDFRDEQLPQLLAKKTAELADRAHAENDLAKAAKEVGATIKSSDLVGRDAQVPEIGALAQVAPQLFDLNTGQLSSAINTGHSGVVAKLTDKQLPSNDDVTKNFEATRDALLDQRREEMFSVFASNLQQQYIKAGRIRMNKKAQQQQQNLPG